MYTSLRVIQRFFYMLCEKTAYLLIERFLSPVTQSLLKAGHILQPCRGFLDSAWLVAIDEPVHESV